MNNKNIKTSIWRIGDLASAAGVSTDTVSHYEMKGALQKARRSDNGYREYPEEALTRVRMIRQALALGFTLDELSEVFTVCDRGGVPCQRVRNLAAEKLSNIEVHLREMMTLRKDLRQTLKDWDKRLSQTTPGQQAGLLKALGRSDANGNPSTTLRLRKPQVRQKGRKRNE